MLGLLEGLQGQSLGTCDLISVKGSDEGPLVVEVREDPPNRLTGYDYHLPILLQSLPKMHQYPGTREAQEAPVFTVLFNLLTLLLLERPMLIVSDDLHELTSSVLALINLLRPFDWHFILAPLLPASLSDRMDAPVPVICGLTRAVYERAKETEELDDYTIIELGKKVTYAGDVHVFGWGEQYRAELEDLWQNHDIAGIRGLLDKAKMENLIKPLIAKEYEFKPPRRVSWRRKQTVDLMSMFVETQMTR